MNNKFDITSQRDMDNINNENYTLHSYMVNDKLDNKLNIDYTSPQPYISNIYLNDTRCYVTQ